MSYTSASPPPLRHPVPTHPAYIPEPPATPVSPQGYQRFSSTPDPQPQQGHSHLQPQYATHVPAYGAPYQQPQQPIHQPLQPQHPLPHQQQQQQQGQSFIPAFGVPTGAWGVNDATAQLGIQLGSSAVAAGQEYVQRNFGVGGNWVSSMKKNFDVSNGYVMNKLALVLFPWRHKPWARKVLRAEQGAIEWQTPRDDINCPDLYIPLMSFATYSLISAFHAGLQERFDPRVLGVAASRAMMVTFFDFLFVYAGCYFLNVQSANKTVTDLIAYAGYKFVGVILLIVTSFLGISGALWYIIFAYLFAANAFFLLRSLRSVILPDSPNAATVGQSQKRRRITFLFLEAVFCQIVWMSMLVRV